MRVLIDYRPALRERSGAGEYTHQLVRALLATIPASQIELTIFSSSWKDRLHDRTELAGVAIIDRRIPVAVLNFAWHGLGWPPAEVVTRRTFDVTHSSHPLLLPARAAAQVVTIHDLNFLAHPERTHAEIRRDYPRLVRDHARRAGAVIVPSNFTAREVERQLGVEPERIAVCAPGAPDWSPRKTEPRDGYILFLGTLEPRKNIGGLLDAYTQLLTQRPQRSAPGGQGLNKVPELVLAGKATEVSREWIGRIAQPPLAGRVRHVGYIDPADRQALFAGARLLVQPSFEEGFGMPVLEAMTFGVPVVVSNRGSLPEVVGDAGPLVNPDEPAALAGAVARLLDDEAYSSACAAKGLLRAQTFRWNRTALRVYEAYQFAIEQRRCASA